MDEVKNTEPIVENASKETEAPFDFGDLKKDQEDTKAIMPEISSDAEFNTAEKESLIGEESKKKVIEIKVKPATKKDDSEEAPIFTFTFLTNIETQYLLQELAKMGNEAASNNQKLPYTRDWLGMTYAATKSTVPNSDYATKAIYKNIDAWKTEPSDNRLGFIDFSKRDKFINGETLSGAKAIRAARAALGGGVPQNLPLYQSGFWISIKPPLEGDWNELDELILDQRKSFGWDHSGMAFSCYTTYLLATCLDFASRYITAVSVNVPEIDSGKITVGEWVLDNIDHQDIIILLAYLAHSAWPRGFPYARVNMSANVNNTEPEYFNERINLYECILHDFSRINEKMLAHMANRSKNSMSVESVEKYKEMVAQLRSDKTEKLNENISFVLAMPKFTDIIRATDSWLLQLKSSLVQSLTQDRTESQKQDYIRKNSKLSIIRAYSPWIKEIILTAPDGTQAYIKEREDIDDTLLDMRNETVLARTAFNAILNYITDSAISQLAVPTDPELENMPETVGEEKKQRIVALDILSLVFTLLEQLRKKSEE